MILVVVGNGGTVIVFVIDKQFTVLVADHQQLALVVVIHGADLVLNGRVGIGYRTDPDDGVFEDFQLFQTSTAGGLPYHTFLQFEGGIDGIREVPGVGGVVVEILHLVFLTVVVAITADVHTDPHHTVGLAELTATTVELGYKHRLLEQLLIMGGGDDAGGTRTIITKPHDAVTVDKDAGNGTAVRLTYHFRFFAVREAVDAAISRAGEDVETIGMETSDFLLGQNGLALQGEVAAVQTVDTLVGTQPDVVFVALGHAGDGQTASCGLVHL